MPQATNPPEKNKQTQKRQWFRPVSNTPVSKKPKETTPQTDSCNESTGTCTRVQKEPPTVEDKLFKHKVSKIRDGLFNKTNIFLISPENFCLFFKIF